MLIEIGLNKDFERCLEEMSIKYGEDFLYLNGIHPDQLNYSTFLNAFSHEDVVADVSIDPNANARHRDLSSYRTEKNKSSDKLFGLNKIFTTIKKQWGLRTAKKWFELEFSRAFYLNDSTSASFFPYCWANDLTRLAKEGLFFLDNYNNLPPKHLSTFFEDVIEFVSFLSNRQSGAVGLPNVLIWAYYFWKKDCETGDVTKDPETYLNQWFQNFIFRLNQPFLRIDQSAFTNVSIFDRTYLTSLFGGMEYPDGTMVIDCIEEIMDFQKKFMERVSEIREENMFTFPILTFSLYFKDNKFGDEEFARWASNHNRKWSDSNFFISDNVGVLSNCCRLLSSLDDVSKNKKKEKLSTFINSIGGSGLSIGSCRVSTINLTRIAQEVLDKKSKNIKVSKEKYIKLLKERTEIDCKALSSMRHIIKRNIEKGLLPNYREGAVELDKQFCTIGILGLYEVIDMFGLIDTDEFGNKSYSEEGMAFASQILDTINEVKDSFQKYLTFKYKGSTYEIPFEATLEVKDLKTDQDVKVLARDIQGNEDIYDVDISTLGPYRVI